MDCHRRLLLPFLTAALVIGLVTTSSHAQVVAPPVPRVTPAQPQANDAQPAPQDFNATPTARDSVVARLIASLMPRHHISSKQLNDELSTRAMDLYLDSLDPLKLYFYQSDVDEFHAKSNSIDDMVRVGDLSLGYDIFRRFISRVDERVAVAQELLHGDFDFNKEENKEC